MTPMQEIFARMDNGDVAYVPISKFNNGYRADINYQVSSGPSFDPTEGPVYGSPHAAFDWMVGTVEGVAQIRSAKIIAIENPCNTEIIPAGDQKRILQYRAVTAQVSVNGQPA